MYPDRQAGIVSRDSLIDRTPSERFGLRTARYSLDQRGACQFSSDSELTAVLSFSMTAMPFKDRPSFEHGVLARFQ